ncbi:MAG: glycosyltransferase family 4 protein [Gammaproteobacteria bacterium]
MSNGGMCIAHINLARGYRGGERQTQLLIEGLAAQGWRQRLIARRGEPLVRRCTSVGGLDTTGVAGNVIGGALALGACDLVHVHEARAMQSAFLNSMVRGTPYLVTRRVQKGPRHTFANRKMYRRAAALVPVSAAIGASLDALDASLDWSVIPDATSTLSFDARRVAELRAGLGGEFLIGHVGALDDSHKGQLQIVAIAARLAQAEPGLRFVLVGGGRDEAMLRQAAAGLDNVRFAGQVEDVGNYLAAFDLFIYPSRHEGLGSILLDALEFALPIVGTAVGGVPEIIEHGSNGLLCAPDDIEALTGAVLRLYRDADFRERVGAVNKSKAEYYSPARMTRRYIDIYAALVDSPAAGRAPS